MKRPSLPAPADAVAPVDGVEVLGLDAAATMAYVTEQRRRRDAAAAEELRAVTHWADLHRVDGDEVGSLDPDLAQMLFPPGTDDSLLGREGELRLAGQGAYRVTEFAVCQLAAAVGMSEHAAPAYTGQALELRDRLPRLHRQVLAGVLPAWKALKIAEETIPVSAAAADYVDAHLAPFAHTLSFTRILRTVGAAIDRHDPDLAADRATKAAERRGVWIDDDTDGVSEIHGEIPAGRSPGPHPSATPTPSTSTAPTPGTEGRRQLRRCAGSVVMQCRCADHRGAGHKRRPDVGRRHHRPRRSTPMAGAVASRPT